MAKFLLAVLTWTALAGAMLPAEESPAEGSLVALSETMLPDGLIIRTASGGGIRFQANTFWGTAARFRLDKFKNPVFEANPGGKVWVCVNEPGYTRDGMNSRLVIVHETITYRFRTNQWLLGTEEDFILVVGPPVKWPAKIKK
jgi:hypothetical protein